ncbi:MAG: A24 family peptidase [Ramlibacter sp.]|nr:A24 family peptidase [Ramlibacter sp.]
MLELSALPAAHASILALLRDGMLAAVVLAAMAFDLKSFRIPNRLTYPAALVGLLLSAGVGQGLSGLAGLGLGFALLLPLWLLRVLGAGDVKLMAAVGAFLGFPEIVGAVLMSFIAGGVLAVGYALWLRQSGQMLRNVQQAVVANVFAIASGHRPSVAGMPSIGKLPYGIGICVGTLAWLAYRHLAEGKLF